MSTLALRDYPELVGQPIEPAYLNWPPSVPKSLTPLCRRFVKPPVLFASSIRLLVEEAPAIRVFLRSEQQNASAIEIASLDVDASALKGSRDERMERANKIFAQLLAKADYQLAAYCASNLWC